ncbi:hypothetical protein HDV00_001318 [Rhizophlyctis rosea]|nr:hypothetical protein HDV00_001318 [Rhizophlyctis rosea]
MPASLVNKYSHVINPDRPARSSVNTVTSQETKSGREDPFMANMIHGKLSLGQFCTHVRSSHDREIFTSSLDIVTHNLQDFVHNVLDAPVSLDPSNVVPAVQPGLDTSVSMDMPRAVSLAGHGAVASQSVDVSPPSTTHREDDGFSVLVKALDTSVTPTSPRGGTPPYTPPVRLVTQDGERVGERDYFMNRVNHTDYDAHEVVEKLKRGRGVDAHIAHHQNLQAHHHGPRRLKYGAWYMKPTRWEEFMRHEDASRVKKPKTPSMKGLVQAKLDHIMTLRAKEEARLAGEIAAARSEDDEVSQDEHSDADVSDRE